MINNIFDWSNIFELKSAGCYLGAVTTMLEALP